MAEKLGTVGVLDILIGGSSVVFNRAVDDAERRLGKLEGSLTHAGKAALMFTSAAAAGAAAVFSFTKGVADTVDEAGKAAEKLSMSVEAYTGYAYAANIANVSNEQFSTGVRQLIKNMVDAEGGVGDAAAAFKALGFDVKDSGGKLKTTDQALSELADRFVKIKGQPEATAYAMKIFGRSGAELIPFLNQGAAGIAELRKEAERLGLVISTEAAKAADDFNDDLDRMKGMAKGLAIEIGGPLVEAIGKAMRAFIDARKEGKDFFDATLEGWRRLATGDDAHKWNEEMVRLFNNLERLKKQQQQLRHGDTKGFGLMGESEQETLARARIQVDAAVKVAEAQIKAHQKIEEQMKGPAAAAASKPGDGGGNIAAVKAEEERAKEIAAARQRAFGILDAQNAANDEAENRRIASQVQARLTAEELFQQQQLELRQMFADREVEMGQATIDRKNLLKTFEFKTDEELANEAFNSRMNQLSVFTDKELELVGGRQAIIERMEQEHAQNVQDIRQRGLRTVAAFTKASFQQQSATVFGELANLSAGVAQHNRQFFELNKIAGGANAIINAHVGATKSLAAYPWPLAGIMAGLHYAAGVAQVAAIKSTTFGGGGGAAPALAGGTAATPVTPVGSGAAGAAGAAGDSQATIINFTGTTDERKLLRRFTEMLNEQRRDGGGRFILAGS